MTLVIGTDEAGYGPNLGPLVVAATSWRVDSNPDEVEQLLASAVTTVAAGLWGDSKKIYRAGSGLDALERGVLVAMALAFEGLVPAGWAQLADRLDGRTRAELPESAIIEHLTLPRFPHEPSCRDQSIAIGESLAAAGIRIDAMQARIVQPAEFNALLAIGLNKSDILSQVTLDLAAGLAASAGPDEPCVIWCDRHGGRRRYAPLVSRAFDLSLVRPLEETAMRSAYALPPGGRIEFTVGGESRIPVAVASMTAKYLREICMVGFNAFWSERVPGLAATAGYPVDAIRWRRDAAAAIEAAGIPHDVLWRRA